MKRVLTAVVLIPIVLLALFRAPNWLFVAVIAAVAFVTLSEFIRLQMQSLRILSALAWLSCVSWFVSLLAIAIFQAEFFLAASLWFVATLGVAMVLSMRSADLREALPAAAVTSSSFAYIAFPLSCLIFIRLFPHGKFFIFYLFVVVWSGDIFAYYVGRTLGRHKLAPRISPGKTWEGSVASLVGSVVLGGYTMLYAPEITQFFGRIQFLPAADVIPSTIFRSEILLSIGINIAAQLGDLAESAIKRGANVKDSGTLLPGHGGMLDRIDALLFAAPVLCYYAFFRLIHFA